MTRPNNVAPEATPPAMRGGRFRRAVSEPLLHFFAVGVIVFGAYALFEAPREPAAGDDRIEIDANDIRQIVVAWMAQGRAPLTPTQLDSLITQKIDEEVLFREGMALSLDRDDEIIKRRIVQKMDFLAADVAALQEPDRAELTAWFAKNAERFALPPRVSFRQLYFSPDRRGAEARDDAAAALASIAAEPIDSPTAAALADPFMLRAYYSDNSPEQVLKEFGPGFAQALFTLAPGGWRGPVQSGYGWHLVWLDALTPGRVPAFEEIEADVRSAWTDERYLEIKRDALAEMRARYTVEVVPLASVDMSALGGPPAASSAVVE